MKVDAWDPADACDIRRIQQQKQNKIKFRGIQLWVREWHMADTATKTSSAGLKFGFTFDIWGILQQNQNKNKFRRNDM